MDEESVQLELSRWLRSQVDATIYWAEDPPKDQKRFQFAAAEGIPDLLVISPQNIVIEVKDGDDSSSIYSAMSQLHEYWRQYEFGNASAIANGESYDVDAFVIATQFSPEGHLFKREREGDFRQTYSNRQSGWNENVRPQFEFARTEAIPRIQWRFAWYEAEYRQGIDRNEIETGLGVLLADVIDSNPDQDTFDEFLGHTDDPTSLPKILQYNGKNASQWRDLSTY